MNDSIVFSRKRIEWIREGIRIFYPAYFYPPDVAITKPFSNSYDGYSKQLFLKYVFLITDTNEISDSLMVLDYWIELIDKGVESDMPAQEILDAAKEMERVKNLATDEKEDVLYNVTENILDFKGKNKKIPKPKELLNKEVQPVATEKPVIKEVIKTPPPAVIPKIVYLNSPEPPESNTVSEEDRVRLENYLNEARSDPNSFVERRVQEILKYAPKEVKNNLSPEQLDYVARIVAIDFTDKLLKIDNNSVGQAQVNILEILSSLANPNDPNLVKIIPDEEVRKQISEAAQGIALEEELDDVTSENLLSPVIGPNLSTYFYNTQKTRDHEISEEPTDQTNYQADVQSMIDYWKTTANIRNQVYKAIQRGDLEYINSLSRRGYSAIVKEYSWYKPITKLKSITGGILPYTAAAGAVVGLSQTSLITRWTAINIPLLASGASNLYLPAVAGVTPGSLPGIAWKGVGLMRPLFSSAFPKSFWVAKVVYTSEVGMIEAASINLGGIQAGLGKFTLGNVFSEGASKFVVWIGKKPIKGPIIDKIGSLLYKVISSKPVAAGTTAALTAGGKAAGGVFAVLAAIPTWLVSLIVLVLSAIVEFIRKNWNKIKTWVKENSPVLAIPISLLAARSLYRFFRRTKLFRRSNLFRSLTELTLDVIIKPLIIGFCVILFLIITIYIINTSGYVVPRSEFAGEEGDCIDNVTGGTPPDVTGVIFSSDNQYAFPVAPGVNTNYACYHWNHKNNVDIFPQSEHQPLVAYTSGTISYVNIWKDDFSAAGGNYIILNGNDGRRYLYSHNCQIFVTLGQQVSSGQVIATTNTTGNAHGEHVHFGISTGGFDFDGAGDICPQADFEDKFNLGNCTDPSQLCI